MDYQEAGVNIEEGYRAVAKYRELAARTAVPGVLNDIGSFAGFFSLGEGAPGLTDPVLVSGTDGVGTKLDLAFRLKKYDTVGIDCVAMCVNDVVCHGARPLFFLDYLACGRLDAAVAAALVSGVATGCREAGAALLGGETAEMPGFYDEGKYDLAGFAVGVVNRDRVIDGSRVREGDVLLGLASSGVHSNGFSLVRAVLPDLDEDFGGMPLGRALLEPTRIYVRAVLGLLSEGADIHGCAHITGGGFYENLPRMFPRDAFDALVRDPLAPGYNGPWLLPPLFARIAAGVAGVTDGDKALREDPALRRQMFNTFNMGVGFVLALAPADVPAAAAWLEDHNYPCWEIGRAAPRAAAAGEVRFV